jgi:hypothetical protein
MFKKILPTIPVTQKRHTTTHSYHIGNAG